MIYMSSLEPLADTRLHCIDLTKQMEPFLVLVGTWDLIDFKRTHLKGPELGISKQETYSPLPPDPICFAVTISHNIIVNDNNNCG